MTIEYLVEVSLMVYLTFLRGCSIQEVDLFKRVLISRAYGIKNHTTLHKAEKILVVSPIRLDLFNIFFSLLTG